MQQFREKMELEAKGELYNMLLAMGQQTLDYYNPCDWRNGKCRRMRSLEDDAGCCVGCEHLSRKGCTVKSLACKLWLCESQKIMFKGCENELEILRRVAYDCGIPYVIRKSKKETLTLQSQPVPQWKNI